MLFVVSSERQSAAGDTQAAIGRQIEARRASMERERGLRETQTRERLAALTVRLSALDAESSQLVREIELQQTRRQLAQASLDRFQHLATSGFVSSIQLQQKQEEMLAQEARQKELERNRLTLARERTGLAAQKDEINGQLQADLAQVERQIAGLATETAENEARRGTVIAAPRAGTVHAISLTAGQSVNAGVALATIVSNGTPLEAHLYAPSRAIGFAETGQKVLIRCAAFPYQKFGLQEGTVVEVARSPSLPDGSLSAATAENAEPSYRIAVKLATQDITLKGDSISLKPGMALEADVIQDRRRVYEWFFEPLLGITHKSEI